MNQATTLPLFITPAHPCAYLPGRQSVSVVADPARTNAHIYDALAQQGFRRSGEHLYRPACGECQACISVRIPVHEFSPRRRDRRCLRLNEDLEVNWEAVSEDEEYFELYRRYLSSRHQGSGMDDPAPSQFLEFLESPWGNTEFLTFREQDRLLAVAVTDRLRDGYSSVYTFFAPEASRRGLGTYAILRQIEQTRRRGLDYLYLGYWIKDCRKMAYKADFRPLQAYVEGRWQDLCRSHIQID